METAARLTQRAAAQDRQRPHHDGRGAAATTRRSSHGIGKYSAYSLPFYSRRSVRAQSARTEKRSGYSRYRSPLRPLGSRGRASGVL